MTKKVMSIQEPSTDLNESRLNRKNVFDHAVFDLPFRGYFLLASFFGVMSLSLWLAFLNGFFVFNHNGLTPVIWHIHEMVFAFGATIAVAFILTAAQTWTGERSLHGKSLVIFISMWIFIRIGLLINSEYSLLCSFLLQVSWWLMAILFYIKLVFSSGNRRNYIFIPMLLLMAGINISVLYAELNNNTALALHLSRSMILVFTLLMGLLGGRVIPFFTVRGAQTKDIKTPVWVTSLSILVTFIGLIVFILSYFLSLSIAPEILMISAGGLHIVRMLYWRSLKTINVPLLWPLHLAYFFMALGLILLGLSYYQIGISFSDALHLINIGAISLMILAMMSRVSLGHTGRVLMVSNIVNIAFIIMLLAAIVRSFLPYVINLLFPTVLSVINNPVLISWNISAIFWVFSLLVFIYKYWPILTTVKK